MPVLPHIFASLAIGNQPASYLDDNFNALRNVKPTAQSSAYTTVVGDHLKTIEVTGTTTISLGDASTMGGGQLGYTVPIVNVGSAVVTVGVITATDKLSGNANGQVTLQPGQGMTFTVNSSNNGYDITAATGFSPFVLTGAAGTNSITANAPANLTALFTGLLVVLTPAGANTGATTLQITPSGGVALAAKSVFWKGAALVGREFSTVPKVLQYDGTQFNLLDGSEQTLSVLRSYLAGLTMSTAGGSATMTIAAGQAVDSTNALLMTLGASIGKTTSAWAVGSGNGGLDTGAIANSTWYHFYLIQRLDTGVVDVLFSLSASAPTMPANYTLKRRIGSGKTDGGGNWTAFTQDGDLFQWSAPVSDVNSTNPGAAAVTRTLTVPTGVNVIAVINSQASADANGSFTAYYSDLATTDTAAGSGVGQILANTSSSSNGGTIQVRTNTSAQIRSRLSASFAGSQIIIVTLGWIDRRGRDV